MTRWVVVGGGAAGSVIAGRLSADPANEVTLLEGGADHGDEPPADDRGPYFEDVARIRTYDMRRRPGGPTQSYLLGSGLGGSSLINGSIVVPSGPGGDGAEHAIPLEPPASVGPIGRAMRDADPRAGELLHATRRNRRVTAADAYLRPHLARSNLTVRTGVEVDRVQLDRRRAIGAVADDGSRYEADRVVLAAGAIASPAILLRSGVDRSGVGDHLQDHPAVALPIGVVPAVRDDAGRAISVATTTDRRQILALERTAPGSGYGALIAGLTRTTSRGTVRLAGDGRPVVQLDQLANDEDRAGLVDAATEMLRIADHPAIQAIATSMSIDDRGTPLDSLDRDPASIERWVLDQLTGFHHVAGTCRCGLVTDADGWVRGYDGLAVADASLFVDAPPINIYLATILQAEQLASRWLARS